MSVFCEDCDHLHSDRKKHPAYWMCLKHKRAEGFGFVTKTKWDSFPPYMYCQHINSGLCPLYEPRKDNANAPEPDSE